MSAISSRNSVPVCAVSNLPLRLATASVNEPFSWPNSSLSISVSGMAAQLTATKGPFDLADSSWIRLAASSLPVPFSPVMSTRASERALWSMSSRTSAIAAELPTMSSLS